jgi:thiamine biosynthesis lipoprotein
MPLRKAARSPLRNSARRVLLPTGPLPVAVPIGSGRGLIRTLGGTTMGTSWTVKLLAPPGFEEDRARRIIEGRLDQVVAEMSTWAPDSAISRFNAAPAGTWHSLPDGFRRVLGYALSLAALTDGAFDPTIGPSAELWGFGPQARPTTLPSAGAVEAARARCSFRRLRLENGRILQPGGVALDLSGIAKGFAVDLVFEGLTDIGCRDLLVEIGGELRGRGTKPDGSPWWVELERPPGAEALPETIVALHGLAAATSGDYRRGYQLGGETFSHTIDPRSGAPVRTGLSSVSVLAPSCMEADALATALTVLGPAEGMRFARHAALAARFITRGAEGFAEHASTALDAMAGQPSQAIGVPSGQRLIRSC